MYHGKRFLSIPSRKKDGFRRREKNFKNGFENGEKRIIVRKGQRIGFPPGKRCPVGKRIIRPADAAGLIFFVEILQERELV